MALRITIVGLGLVGSSMGLALKQTGADLEIIGHDKDHDAARRAHRSGCVHRTEWNLISACDGADLVVLSIPLASIRSTLAAIAPELKEGCVVTDTASIKVPVLDWARELLPPTVHFVGGHPILQERDADLSTRAEASSGETMAGLLAGAVYCLTPGTATPPAALQRVTDLVEAVAARPYYMDAAEHDGLIAAVEQIPLLAALALQGMAAESASRREMMRLSGADFNSVTQLLAAVASGETAGEAQRLSESCTFNRANLARWLDILLTRLAAIRELVANGDGESLQAAFASALEARAEWARGDVGEAQPTDYSPFSMTRMMLGDSFRPRPPKPQSSGDER